ncbi:DUF4062 domain-containing protein [Pantoea vagans]|nr:DUF4062 domain-containing protein [Pantoea vagans]
MDKRYQVFVSSTFKDLEEERSSVIQTLMEMDCIPAGMELFPAIDEEQWEFIKKIIDDCDYYLLIIGGRYGTLAPDGKSYTEMEFDYAVEKGKRVVVLVHENLSSLPASKTEPEPAFRQKLDSFISKATSGRLRKTWTNPSDLAGKVSLSMQKTIKTYPAIGWVRADKVTNHAALTELADLKNENAELKNKISELESKSELTSFGELANFDSSFELKYSIGPLHDDFGPETKHEKIWKWKDLYHFISPYIYKHITQNDLYSKIRNKIDSDENVPSDCYVSLDDSDLQTMELQFIALGLVQISKGIWSLTPKGVEKMMEVRVIK